MVSHEPSPCECVDQPYRPTPVSTDHSLEISADDVCGNIIPRYFDPVCRTSLTRIGCWDGNRCVVQSWSNIDQNVQPPDSLTARAYNWSNPTTLASSLSELHGLHLEILNSAHTQRIKKNDARTSNLTPTMNLKYLEAWQLITPAQWRSWVL